jgi:PAS domain S-box-containing protein
VRKQSLLSPSLQLKKLRWQSVAGSVGLALFYFAAARVGSSFKLPGANASVFWPASGVGFASLLLFGLRLWPGIAAGAFLTNLLTQPHGASGLAASFAIAAGNTLEQVAAVMLLRRIAGNRNPFDRTKDTLTFIAASLLSCTVASTIGTAALWLTGILDSSVFAVWLTWWTGDATGMVVFAPAIYCWIREPRLKYRTARLVELFALMAFTAVIAELRFGGWFPSEIFQSLPYIVLPALLWSAFRFGPREASTAAVLSSSIAVAHTWRHLSQIQSGQVVRNVFAPFITGGLTPTQSLLMLQVFICAVSFVSLTLAASIAERTRFQDELAEAERRFRTIFEQAAVGVALIETATGRFVRVNKRYCALLGYTAAELTDKTLHSITHPEDLARNLDDNRRMVAGEIREFKMEKRYYRKDGSVIWVNLTVSPTWGPGEKPEYDIAVAEEITARKEAEEAQRAANEKLQHLSREVIRMRDTERRHLARELHDEIGQNLAALRINMQLLRNTDAFERESDRVTDSVAIIDRILAEVRDLSLSLRPPLLNEAGLAAALRSHFEEQSARTGLSIEFVSTIENSLIDAETALALFRIAQEALTNTIRHAGAERVVVSLERIRNQVHLVIRDDGHGIPVQPPQKLKQRPRLGLIGMQERAALLGGVCSVSSVPDTGTVVSVEVPIRSGLTLASEA